MLLLLLLLLVPLLDSVRGVAIQPPKGPITDHFIDYLNRNDLGSMDYARTDYGTQGSFGGFQSESERNSTKWIGIYPVVFFHGNTDSALQTSDFSTGFSSSIEYFLIWGYPQYALYVTSWGDNLIMNAKTRSHTCYVLQRLRYFVLAVLDYTQSPYISIVAHSMGVTLARRVVKGGRVEASDGTCFLGGPLTDQVLVFVALAGCNYGICSCSGESLQLTNPTCNSQDGFWPGDYCVGDTTGRDCSFPHTNDSSSCTTNGMSKYLSDLNADTTREAKRYIYSVWSVDDDLICNGDYVFGRLTSLVPGSDGVMTVLNYTHMETKDMTTDSQFDMVMSGSQALPLPFPTVDDPGLT